MKILMPVDGSSLSTRAARYVASHKIMFGNGTKITLLHVDIPLPQLIHDRIDPATASAYHTRNGRAALRSAWRVLTNAGRDFDEKLLVGDPGTEITHLAQRDHYDLIVMGSHGHGAMKGLLLGSVVTKVLAQSRVPVLVVR